MIIESQSLVVGYGNQRANPIIDGLHFSAFAGDIKILWGPSGSGKTTLLNSLAGFIKPWSGMLAYRGHDITDLTESATADFRNRNIGMIHQSFNLIPAFSARMNVAAPLLIAGGKSKNSLDAADRIMDSLGISHRKDARPSELSGGEQQRVALARALVNEPDLLLADEPTGNLDEHNSQKILGILADQRDRGRAIIIATHDPRVAGIGTDTLVFPLVS